MNAPLFVPRFFLPAMLAATLLGGCATTATGDARGSAPSALAAPVAPGLATVRFDEMKARLEAAAAAPHATMVEFGRSVESRPLLGLEVLGPPGDDEWRVLLFGLQHGDEPAGKDALVVLAERLASDRSLAAPGARVLIVPMINPDGGEQDQRRNAASFDLNRDHLLLSQPETRALHALARSFQPHVAVDCHEFTRDSSDYRALGFSEWPLIMMDSANNATHPDALFHLGLDWVESAAPAMKALGHNYCRYHVGGPPPFAELRPSTTENDDARNGLGALGALSFIIESGVMRSAPDPSADLHERVSAYLVLLGRFANPPAELRARSLAAVEAARSAPAPASIPTNVFWGSLDPRAGEWPVIDLASGRERVVPAYNLMDDRVIKKRVPTPMAYVIPPAHAAKFAPWLEAHGLPHEVLSAPRQVPVEKVRLVRIEEEVDEVYERYDGRLITMCEEAQMMMLEPGALWVQVEGIDGARAAMLMEPQRLYGLYEWPEWRALAGADGELPVWRVARPQGR